MFAFGIVCQFSDTHVTTFSELHMCAQAYSPFQCSGLGESVLGSIRVFTLPLTPGQPRDPGANGSIPNPRGLNFKTGLASLHLMMMMTTMMMMMIIIILIITSNKKRPPCYKAAASHNPKMPKCTVPVVGRAYF